MSEENTLMIKSDNINNIKPDIMTIAKGLSSGYQPIGGSIISTKISDVIKQIGGEFNHGYTYSAHPVAAAVALENIRILEDQYELSLLDYSILTSPKNMYYSELFHH